MWCHTDLKKGPWKAAASARARAAGSVQSAPFWESSPLGRVYTVINMKDTNKGSREGFRMEPEKQGGCARVCVCDVDSSRFCTTDRESSCLSREGYDLRCKMCKIKINNVLQMWEIPVIRQQSITEDEPPPLVSFQIVSPFKEPAFVGVRARGRGRGRGRSRGAAGCRAGRRALYRVTHPVSGPVLLTEPRIETVLLGLLAGSGHCPACTHYRLDRVINRETDRQTALSLSWKTEWLAWKRAYIPNPAPVSLWLATTFPPSPLPYGKSVPFPALWLAHEMSGHVSTATPRQALRIH